MKRLETGKRLPLQGQAAILRLIPRPAVAAKAAKEPPPPSMKFLCDNCKAKYQIADEKVAGKTVRMKCRKCGHQIEVRAAVTETSVSTSLSPGKPSTLPNGRPTPGSPMSPQKSSGTGGGLATSLSAQKPRAPSAPSANKESSLANAFMNNVQEAPASVPAGGGLIRGTPIELSVTDEWYVAINGVPVGPVRISELRRKAAAGAVTEDSLCWQEGLEEWRPIKSIPDLASLVREAALGNRPSLIGEPPPPPPARSPSIPSAPKQPAAAPAAPASPFARNTPAPSPGGTQPSRPMSAPSFGIPNPPAPPPAARSNVVPIRPSASPLGGGGLDDLGGAVAARNQSYPDAGSAAPAFSLTPAPPAPMLSTQSQPLSSPMQPIAPAVDPFALPPMSPTPTPPPVAPIGAPLAGGPSMMPSYADVPRAPAPSMAPPPAAYMEPPRKAGVPLWFWPILVLALGFGGGVAFLVFRPQPAPQPVVIQMPSTATAQPTDNNNNNNIPPPSSAEPPTSDTSTPNKAAPGKPIAKANPKPGPTEEKKGLDLGGLVPNSGGGPNVGPNGPSGGAGGGLDQAGVERVVAGHRQGVKRTCWERGGSDQKSSVNVTVTANVASNGSVASTSSTGDDPVVAKCIESQVKTWQFPAPGAPTTINIPFKFVRQ